MEGANKEGNRSVHSPEIARPYLTPASDKTAAGERLSGGPGREFRFSKVSGAPRFAVNITGILAAANSSATYGI